MTMKLVALSMLAIVEDDFDEATLTEVMGAGSLDAPDGMLFAPYVRQDLPEDLDKRIQAIQLAFTDMGQMHIRALVDRDGGN